MRVLKDILYKVEIDAVVGNTSVTINRLQFDSRKVELNDAFVAIRGSISDGHEYIEQAIEKGALAVICEELPKEIVNGVTYIKVGNAQQALAFMAANYYDNP